MATSNRFDPPICRILDPSKVNLDKSTFQKDVGVIGLRVPTKSTSQWMQRLNKNLLDIPKIKSVVADGDSKDTRILLLQPNIDRDLNGFNDDESKDLIFKESLEIVEKNVHFDYDYWTADEILSKVLPEELQDETPNSFTVVGHIAHMNLRDHYLPWKYIIGQIILDKNAHIQTVVNKIDTIDTEFRNFKMEILAGKPEFNVQVRENDCRYRFDFSKVYWNSRLDNEHGRIIQLIKKGQVIADVFAGVGPFAIPAAKKYCFIYANDLNPASYESLNNNIPLNKVTNFIRPFNLDGREFMKMVLQDLPRNPFKAILPKVIKKGNKRIQTNGKDLVLTSKIYVDHFILNLPAIAIEFLDVFKGISVPNNPLMHVYCFSKFEDPRNDILNRIETAIGYRPVCIDIPPQDLVDLSVGSGFIHYVRKVAPSKSMYCITFRLK